MTAFRSLARSFRRNPGFTVTTIVTIGVAIGANAAIFSLIYGILLQPLPYHEADRLVSIQHDAPGLELRGIGLSQPLYLRYREVVSGLDTIGLYNDREMTLTGGERPQRVRSAPVNAQLFEALRVSPLVGRWVTEDDSRPNAAPVVVIGEGLWRSRFGADPALVGRTVEVDGTSREVVGVAPAAFRYPAPETELWVQMTVDPAAAELGAFRENALARLAPGASVASVQADLDRILADLESAFPDAPAGPILAGADFRARVVPLREEVVGDLGDALWALFGGVVLILLIACANVANLFLARGEGRQREVAIRSALGAPRAAIVRRDLVESLLLALLGGVLGVPLAAGAVRLVQRFGPEELPRLQEVGLQPAVLLFALAISLLAGVLFGIVPALRASAPRQDLMLGEGSRGASAGRQRHLSRNLLVGAQVALALVLLVAAGLMLRSLERLSRVELGFRPENVLTLTTPLPPRKYDNPLSIAQWLEAAIAEIRSLPSVESVAVVRYVPLSGELTGSGYAIEGREASEELLPPVFFENTISPEYFATLGIPLVEGRVLERSDWEERRGVVVVSQALADHFWPGESALGRRLVSGRPDPEGAEAPIWYEVVGVAGDVRTTSLEDDPPWMVYYSYLGLEAEDRGVEPTMSFLVRTRGAPAAVADAVRERIWALESDVAVTAVRTLDELVARARSRTAFIVVLFGLASALALLLSLVGLYGVESYIVSLRRREFGIRMAVGADRRRILRMVLGEVLLVAGAGVVAGVVIAVLPVRSMRALLFGIDVFDPATFAGTALFLIVACALASLAPAGRATRIDPQVALREE